MTSFRPVFAALLVSFLVTACGGGGGSSETPTPAPTPTPTPTPTPLPADPDLQTTVPEPASADLKALNTLRGKLGLGLLIEDGLLVTASTKHAQYEGTSGGYVQSHSDGGGSYWTEEVPGSLNFVGVTATDRCLAAGYSGICNDVVTLEGDDYDASTPPDNGQTKIGNLDIFLAGPYGGVMMFMQHPRDAGVFRVGGLGFLDQPIYIFSWHFGTPTSGGQRQGSGFVLTYPLPDSTVLTYPLPDTTVLTTLFGHAINLHINDGETLSVDSFTLLDNNGNTVAATLLTQATDPKKFVPGHIAVLVPNAPLVAGNYTVIFWGKRNGTVFSRIWNFSVSYILNP